jgi:hypothetical protein
MISVLMECGHDEAALAVTLSSLVPGAVEGLIGDVVLVDLAMTQATHQVADAAGCRVMPSAPNLSAAVKGLRGTWVLMLEAGARPQGNWIDTCAAHMALSDDAARFRALPPAHPWWKRLRLPGRPVPLLHAGLLMPRSRALAAASSAATLAELARAAPRRVVRLDAAIVPAAPRRSVRGADARPGEA